MSKYIIASSKDWFQNSKTTKEFEEFNFIYLNNKEDLELSKIEKINPRFIFFPHWSWMVPKEIHQNYDCVVFHTAPLPYGRGGSPIQNLILRNFKESPVCALKMNNILDGGPIYLTKEVSLLGSADEIFMRENTATGLYEYVATYVDDLCLVMKEPETFLTILQSEPYNFKLKGSGPVSFHLGCGFERDEQTGILAMTPQKYIEKMNLTYQHLYGEPPNKSAQSPLEENDHPELDTSEFLDEEGIQQYQSLIGSMQWLIAIGRWDIQTAVMSLSSFRAQPRKGHIKRVKRIYGYINRFKLFDLKFRTEEPEMSQFDNKTNFDWSKSIYGDHSEELPDNAPKPLGKRVTLTHYFDANLMHDVLSGKAVTGIIHLINKTPIMWYSKKQATSETATYGAEFVAGRTCIEQVIDLRNSLRYLGVPINDISYVFGDNETMINSSSFPHARLHKRHNILTFHFVRSMIAKGFIALNHL